MNFTTIPEFVNSLLPDVEIELPIRNVLPDEEEGLEDGWDFEELNFDDEV